MPFDPSRIAYASNDAGKGDLNCLAHVLVANFRKMNESLRPAFWELYRQYCLKRGRTPITKGSDEFYQTLMKLTALEVEKEITPLLEDILNTIGDKDTTRLKKFITLVNSLGLKVKIHVENPEPFPGFYLDNFKPSTSINQTPRRRLEKGIPNETTEIVSELGIDQTHLEDDVPTLNLFLEDPNDGSPGYNCHFEYPFYLNSKEERELRERHNTCIRKENRKIKKERSEFGREKPHSFTQGISALFMMFGGIFTKLMEACLGAFQKYQSMFGEALGREKDRPSTEKSDTEASPEGFSEAAADSERKAELEKSSIEGSRKPSSSTSVPGSAAANLNADSPSRQSASRTAAGGYFPSKGPRRNKRDGYSHSMPNMKWEPTEKGSQQKSQNRSSSKP